MTFGHCRFPDEADKLPQKKSVESAVKPRHQMFTVHEIQAVIEKMNYDSDEDNNAVVKGNQPGVTGSEDIAAATTDHGVMQSAQKKKLKSRESSRKHDWSNSSEQQDADVEPDGRSDFTNQLTKKLQTVAIDLGNRDSEDSDAGQQKRKKRLSLKKDGKKTGADISNPIYNDGRDRHEANSSRTKTLHSSSCLTRASDKDPMMPVVVKQKSSSTKWLDVTSRENMEDWDCIESVSDSDRDEPFNFESKPSDTQPAWGTRKRLSKVVSSRENKRQRTPAHQLVKPSSRPNKVLKYYDRRDASNEITDEEDGSDVVDDTFLSATSSSPAAASVKGHTPSKRVTGSFWQTSPESKKSLYTTDDEFVSNLSCLGIYLLLSRCISVVNTY